MSDHLLRLDRVEEGCAVWRLTCEHPEPGVGEPHWAVQGHEDSGECWLMTWWDGVGQELVDILEPVTALPIPVGPAGDWDNEDGGRIVKVS